MTEQYFELTHTKLAFKRWGKSDKTVILALHGWLDNLASYTPLMAEDNWLSDISASLIAVDWPGHGHSSKRPEHVTYSLVDYVYDLRQLIKALKSERLIILGHSLGGSVATLYAGSYPESIQHLILIESMGPVTIEPQMAPEQLRKAIDARQQQDNAKAEVVFNLETAVRKRVQMTGLAEPYARMILERNTEEQGKLARWRSDQRLRTPSMMMFTEEEARRFLECLTMPVDLIYGKEGYIHKYPAIQTRLDAVHDITTHELPGGHHLHMEHPELVREVLSRILA